MLLAIDIGNTDAVFAAFEGSILQKSWRVKTDSLNNRRTYVVDRNINYANYCTAKCIFCNFKADPPGLDTGRKDLPDGYGSAGVGSSRELCRDA